MIKRIKNKHLLSSKTNDVSKNPIRVLYKKVGQPSEVKIISDVYKLKKAIIERSLDIIPYEKIFIICHSKKSNSNMFPNIFLPLKRILGDLIVVNIDKKEREFKRKSRIILDSLIGDPPRFIETIPSSSSSTTVKNE